MKPTKCQCGMFIAPQFKRCPRCDERVHHPNHEESAAEKLEAALANQARLDAEAKVLDATKLKWVIPLAAQKHLKERYRELKARRLSSKTALKLFARDAEMSRAGRWTWEYGPKGIRIAVSPKNNRYVEARSNEHSHLVLDYGTKDASGWLYGRPVRVRLRRFENSRVAKELKKEEQAQRADVHRKKAKRKARKQKKLMKRKLAVAS